MLFVIDRDNLRLRIERHAEGQELWFKSGQCLKFDVVFEDVFKDPEMEHVLIREQAQDFELIFLHGDNTIAYDTVPAARVVSRIKEQFEVK